ncbi:ABC transporter substrate-binding protein [Candidatus Poribacteria bacterium]|nr:ABC transporter substrate-binding protein [Candidatus Poribacteria bacterium]MYA56543.1 ABC transporter substrate-binding protein [Candidatus Poribacteria bacterium]
MNPKIFRLTVCILLGLSVAYFSAGERTEDVEIAGEPMPALKVGLIHPLLNYATFGDGARLAVAEINKAGGVLGRQVELLYKVELGSIADSATELAEMENVVAILGPMFSSSAVKVGPIINIPVIVGATGADVTNTGNDPRDFLFLVANSNALQAKVMAGFVVNDLGKKTAAMLWQNGDVYSKGFVNAFDANFKKLGGRIVASQTYEQGDTTFHTQLAIIKESSPDVLLLASFPPENPRIVKQAREMRLKTTFIGSDGWDDPLMLEILEDNRPLENSYYCSISDELAADFTDAYETMFKAQPIGIAPLGYDAMKLLAIAIENAQSTDPVMIRDAVAAITDYQGATTISSFDGNRHPIKPAAGIRVLKIVEGQPQQYTVLKAR